MKYAAILAVLCLAGTVFGAYSYDAPSQTLSLAQSDLVHVIAPGGTAADTGGALSTIQQSFGVDVGTFSALPGLEVINFGNPTAAAVGNPTSLQVNGLVTFNFGTNFTPGQGDTGYWWGGRTSYGRTAFSGPNTYSDISTVRTFPPADNVGGNTVASWFDVESITGANLTAVGFCVCAHSPTSSYYMVAGDVKYLLDDGTSATVAYPALGNGSSPALNQIWIGYQAPAGRHIVGFYAEHPAGGSTDYLGIDDLSFVPAGAIHYIQPHDGDANNDGKVDVVDLGILAKNYDATGLPTSAVDPYGAGSWQLGDFNGDGNVDVVDLGILAKNYDWIGAPATASVPEPATLSLLGLAAATLIRRKR